MPKHYVALLLLAASVTATNGALRGHKEEVELPDADPQENKPTNQMMIFELGTEPNAGNETQNNDDPWPIAIDMDDDEGDDASHTRMLATGNCGIFADNKYFYPQAGSCYSLGGTSWNDKATHIRASSNTCIRVWEHDKGGRNGEYCGSDWFKLQVLPRQVSHVCCESRSSNTNSNTNEGSTVNNAWLQAHNSRRQKYHHNYGKSYVPLKWSNSLASSAQNYAQELARTGRFVHGSSGENLAWNSGRSSHSAENILTRWVENEERERGGHFTQVLWRATKYVGCGTASSSHGSYQVCRYVTPGNCNGRTLSNMLKDSTGCSPRCPPEGCF